MLLLNAAQAASFLKNLSHNSLCVLAGLCNGAAPLQLSGASLEPRVGIQLLTARAASSKGRGRKHPSHVKGYDRLLHQWAHMTAVPSKGRGHKGER